MEGLRRSSASVKSHWDCVELRTGFGSEGGGGREGVEDMLVVLGMPGMGDRLRAVCREVVAAGLRCESRTIHSQVNYYMSVIEAKSKLYDCCNGRDMRALSRNCRRCWGSEKVLWHAHQRVFEANIGTVMCYVRKDVA